MFDYLATLPALYHSVQMLYGRGWGKDRGVGEAEVLGGKEEWCRWRSTGWAQIKMLEETWELFFFAISELSVTDSGNVKYHTDLRMFTVPTCGGPSDYTWKHLPKAFTWDERHWCPCRFPGTTSTCRQCLLRTGLYSSWCSFFLSNKNKQGNGCLKLEFFVYIKQILGWKSDGKCWLKTIITQNLEIILHGSIMFLGSYKLMHWKPLFWTI